MNMSVWDIVTLINFLFIIIKKYFPKKNKYTEIVMQDILLYANTILKELSTTNERNNSPQELKIILWTNYDFIWKENKNLDDFNKFINAKDNLMIIWFKNYLKSWEYKFIFWYLLSKFEWYMLALKKLFQNYWIKQTKHDIKLLQKEKEDLNNFINENIDELHEAFTDYLISIIDPTYQKNIYPEEKEYIWKLFDIYISTIKIFLKYTEKRILYNWKLK